MRDTQFRTIFYFAHKHGYFRRSPVQQYNYMIKKISLVKTQEIASYNYSYFLIGLILPPSEMVLLRLLTLLTDAMKE